ncbi:MAG: ABC transporter permease [Planctomycetes bacterium]|nr:ABC transporter permease [Planctomycetota bacterium]
MLLQTAVVGTAAVGATWIIVSGGIDLSVGANIALSSMVGAWLLRDGHGFVVAASGSIATGAAVGWLIGALVVGHLVRALLTAATAALLRYAAHAIGVGEPWAAMVGAAGGAGTWWAMRRLPWRLPLSPFIVTLGLWGALRGLAKGLGGQQPIYFEADDTLRAVMQPGPLLPPGVWVMLGTAAIAALLLKRSVFGRHTVALGSSRDTARLCGVDLGRTELSVYVLGCGCAGIAAVMQTSFLSMGDPMTGQGYELKAIAAAVIGGASLTGGEGAIFGTLLGALIMTVVDNGCTKLELDNWVQEVVTGAIIVGAVALDRWRQSRAS